MNPILRRVREVIGDSGLNQPELAKAGIASQSLLSKWATNDEAEPSSGSLTRIAEGLQVNGHWLLTGQGEKRAAVRGGDAAFRHGFLAGLAAVEREVERLRATGAGSGGVTEAERIADLQRAYAQAEADLRAHARQQKQHGRAKRA